MEFALFKNYLILHFDKYEQYENIQWVFNNETDELFINTGDKECIKFIENDEEISFCPDAYKKIKNDMPSYMKYATIPELKHINQN